MAADKFDFIIIGARIAGSVLASCLGEYGYRVLLLDRATFPSDTLSTHFFRAPALRAFDRIGVLDSVLASAPHLTVNYNAVGSVVFPEPVDRPQDYPFYMCVRRITLDQILVDRARSHPSVEFRQGAVVDELLWDSDRCVGVAWREDGGRRDAHARAIIGADGVYSFVARQVKPKAEDETPVQRAMYYAYCRGIAPEPGPAAEFHYRGNQLVYCFPTDSDLTLLAASVPIERFRSFKRDPVTQLQAVVESMHALRPRMDGAERGARQRQHPRLFEGAVWRRLGAGRGFGDGDGPMVRPGHRSSDHARRDSGRSNARLAAGSG